MNKLATVLLPDNLHWSDEYAWSPADQSTARTLSGALIVEETARSKGRPITLSNLWVNKTTVDSLRTLEAQVATEMTLILGSSTFTTLWKRDGDTPAVEATPVFLVAPSVTPDTFNLTLHLMEA